MTEQITLTPYMRSLLLEEICARLNIIEYCEYFLKRPLTQSIQNTFTGNCPYCAGYMAFVINKSNGKYFCMSCKCEGDFLTLMCEKEHRDLNASLQVISGYLETAEERERKSRYTREVMV
jgi:hypothetical protein